ncbi:MAG: hypothetical protein ACYST2_04820, partial [Planctomycetota bacterium]
PFGSQLFSYTLRDQNGNPLVEGTRIEVKTSNGEVSGDSDFTMEDTQSRVATQFSFVLENTQPDSNLVKNATVTIKVTSQNGNSSRSVRGQMLPILETGNASIF